MSDYGLNILDNPALGIFWGTDEEATDSDAAPEQTPSTAAKTVGGPMRFAIRVGTCNVRNTPDLPRPKVVQAGHDVRDKFDLIGFQELGEQGEDRRDVLTGLGDMWRMTAATPTDVQTQIGWRTDRVTINSGQWTMTVPGRQPYPNPPRGWTMANVIPQGGFPFKFYDTHFVNKAWNTVPDSHKALRKRNWDIHYAKLNAEIRAASRTSVCVVVGDFNRLAVTPFGPNFRWLSTGGIDKIGVALPKGYGVQVLGHIDVNTPSDHNAIGVRLRLIRK